MENNQTFYLGLCMAGAVSAGAYTAGVMDFLIEALDTWEQQRGNPNIPSHRVKIPVMGGASAGGMTSIIAASAINNTIEHVKKVNGHLTDEQPNNKFYHSWVDLIQEDMFPLMLRADDIEKNRIYSLLNSNFIDEVARRALKVDKEKWIQRPYFDEHTKVFTTLSNLEGFSFNIGFRGSIEADNYYVSRHNDYATFVLNSSDSDYAKDGWIPLDFKNDLNVDVAGKAAMATGAFPVGLKARKLKRPGHFLNEHKWLTDVTRNNPLPDGEYETLNVDGGLINNEPFEKVRSVLNEITGQKKQSDIHNFDRFSSSVLMIDPFPSTLEQFNPDESLGAVIGSTFAAMLGHLRTKTSDLAEALKYDRAGQFLIGPKRRRTDNNGQNSTFEGAGAIACGSMGGFGGFLHKEFRIHDFFLGRANCEQFLREHFTIPENTANEIFKEGYRQVENKKPYQASNGRLQIIPVFKPKESKMFMPVFQHGFDWPVRKVREIDRFQSALKNRTGAFLMNLAEFRWWERGMLWIGSNLFLKKKVAREILKRIKNSLEEHQLIKE